jgi:dTDP-4-dehydrorhamnose reductase
MILLLGGSGYIGSAFQSLLNSRGIAFRSIARAQVDYYDKSALAELIDSSGAKFLINAAGYTGKPNVDACELAKADTLLGNAILPGILREVCEDKKLPWGHVSSGCIYTGRRADGAGFSETDAPNFSFRTNNCSFYSGSKALGEEILAGAEACYIWRLRIPFDNINSPRNYISKLLNYAKLLEAENSISHRAEFVAACLACHQQAVPYGIYNVTNPGTVTTRRVVELIKTHLTPGRDFAFFEDEDSFMKIAAKTPRSNCVLNSSQLGNVGIHMTPVEEAIIQSLQDWQK